MLPLILLLLVSIVIVTIGVINLRNYKRLSTIGIEAEGIVFDTESGDVGSNGVIYPIIRFLTADNDWITQKASVSGFPGSYKAGQKVTVVYDRNNPTDFFIKSSTTSKVITILIVGGSLLIGYAGYALIKQILSV